MARILVVEDDPQVAIPLVAFLGLMGHLVRQASNGEEGLAEVSKEYPEIILLDVDMPTLNGPQMAYRLLIEDAGREDIPIMLLSAVDDLGSVAESIGTPYFLAKPYSFDGLTTMLDRALRERQPPRPRLSPLHQKIRGAA